MRKFSLISKCLFILHLLAIVGILLGGFAVFISPVNYWFIALFGLAFPFLVVIALFLSLYWLFRRRFKIFFFSILLILPVYSQLENLIALNRDTESTGGDNSMKVLSFNTRLFDLYNWSENKKTRNKIFDFLKETDADIICFQEYFQSANKGYFATTDTLVKFLKAKNFHFKYTTTANKSDSFGIATFTKFPIEGKGVVDFSEKGNNICIYTDIKVNGKTVRVYNAHLASIHFGKDEYEFLEKFRNNSEVNLFNGRKILQRLKSAWKKRALQVEKVSEHIQTTSLPVIVCGDFNDPPISYTYHRISTLLTDAFNESGRGFGFTYNGAVPGFRIDYIFHSPELKSFEFKTIHKDLSDHFPISCRIAIPPTDTATNVNAKTK